MKMCYQYYRDPEAIADGRPYKYMAKELQIPREYMSLILRGQRLCTIDQALMIVNRFDKNGVLEDYFKNVKGAG